ncbi:GTP-binding protein [Tritrichomonas musculus]|uniref:GTP-binding protein n=1 Tax=Tritrichomonas musculus TaxID=1915356 RepID=A0ABR2IXE2_9EUKA
MNQEKIVIKIVGQANSGKTSIFNVFNEGTFQINPISTVGPDFANKEINISNHQITLQIWDIHGGENLRNIVKCYYRGSSGFLIVFDITRKESFEDVKFWINSIQETDFPQPVTIALAGNKSDLKENRQVTKEEAELFAAQNDIHYFEISAKNNEGINDVFNYLATQSFNRIFCSKEEPDIKNEARGTCVIC